MKVTTAKKKLIPISKRMKKTISHTLFTFNYALTKFEMSEQYEAALLTWCEINEYIESFRNIHSIKAIEGENRVIKRIVDSIMLPRKN